MRPLPRRSCCIQGRWWWVRSKERGAGSEKREVGSEEQGARSEKKTRGRKYEGNGEPSKEDRCAKESVDEAEAASKGATNCKARRKAAQAAGLRELYVSSDIARGYSCFRLPASCFSSSPSPNTSA